jgi:hypothetical protein
MRAVASTSELAHLLLWVVVHVIGCREPATNAPSSDASNTRDDTRRRLPLSTSSRHGDDARHDPQAHRLRARSSPARRSASRWRGGAGRWAIHWAKPRRTGPYQPQRRALTVGAICADLQAFRGLRGPRTPCFTRERTLVRNQPRPSERCSFAGTFVRRRRPATLRPRLGVPPSVPSLATDRR